MPDFAESIIAIPYPVWAFLFTLAVVRGIFGLFK